MSRPDELIAQQAFRLCEANPLLTTEGEKRAFLEGFQNGSHWSFSVVVASVSKWLSPEPPKEKDESHPSDQS